VQQGTNLVAAGSSRDLVVRVPVEESLLRFITVGEDVPVTINAFARELTGTILRFEPVADVRTKNVFLKIGIPPQEQVAENMSATVFVPTGVKRDLSIIPRDALISLQGKDFVYTVREGRAAILPVNIVTYLGGRIATDSPDLLPGTPVVVEGNERLRPDQPVAVAGDR
jgi:membrane fusion protein, multidrug efflux system